MSNIAKMPHDKLPVLALCAGEPAGIGPDIVVSIAQQDIAAKLLCIADPTVIKTRAAALGLDLNVLECTDASDVRRHERGSLTILPSPTNVAVVPGQLDTRNAAYVLHCLDLAINAARRNDIDVIVTGPVHKGIINDAGYAFTGHTEYLTHGMTPRPEPVMMLASGRLRVALATTHMALSAVPQALSVHSIVHVIEVVASALSRNFDIDDPRIAVCGLNPHAGENGHFGREDIEIVAPAIAKAQSDGIQAVGPLPADTAFAPQVRESFDAYVTMYHDQGLPVIKALGFGEIVNITLGLPILRTSVDHGTALDIAGTGKAQASSLLAAVNTAIALSTHKRA